MIYLSTGGFYQRSAYQTVIEFAKYGICNIELSGGIFDPNQIDPLKKISSEINLQLHNYFPPPQDPFVLNLASQNDNIRLRSIALAERALLLSSEIGANSYAIHAGFLIDPRVSELGRTAEIRVLSDRNTAIETFINSINYLATIAERLNLILLIENNVVSKRNANQFSQNPFLMADPSECKKIMSRLPCNVNLLIDVAHLKVSAKSLNFKPENMFSDCMDWIYGYHLSDNNGEEDANEVVTKTSWFWPFINKNAEFFTVEVYEKNISTLLNQIDLVSNFLEK